MAESNSEHRKDLFVILRDSNSEPLASQSTKESILAYVVYCRYIINNKLLTTRIVVIFTQSNTYVTSLRSVVVEKQGIVEVHMFDLYS